MLLNRILNNQLHLHDEGNPAWGTGGIPPTIPKPNYNVVPTPKNLAETLKELAEAYISPKIEEIQERLENVAKDGKYQLTVKKSELDSFTENWLKNQGITLKERWSGNQIDGETVVDLKW